MNTVTKLNQDATQETVVPVRHEDRDTHAVGTSLGAVAGGVAGAAAGVAASAATGIATGTVLGGPIGGAIGLVAGALVGGVLGSEAGEAVNPSDEALYWSTSYQTEPYYVSTYSFDDYLPAYRTGYEGYHRYAGKSYEDVEGHLQEDYIGNRGNSRLAWEEAQHATRSAWNRLGSVNRNAVN